MPIEINSKSNPLPTPWNKGRLVGQKHPLRPKEVWAIRVRPQIKRNKRDLAMFNITSPSTASFGAAISSAFGSMTSPSADT